MDRETLRKLAATQMPTSMKMIQQTAQSPSAAPPIAPPQSVTVQPTGANKNAALRSNQDADVPVKKVGTIDHAFTEQSPDIHKSATEKLKGGLADGKKPSDFDPKKLSEGMQVEREHTTNKGIQKEISMDHLTEDPEYYKKLKTIEKDGDKKEKRDFTIWNGGKPPKYTLSKESALGVRPQMPGARMLPTAPRAAGQQAALNKFQVGGATATGIQAAPQTASGLDLAAPQRFGYGVPAPQGMTGLQQPSGLELAMDPMKARGRVSMASVYEQGVKEALEKFAVGLAPALGTAGKWLGRVGGGVPIAGPVLGGVGGVVQGLGQGEGLKGAVVRGGLGAATGLIPGVGGMVGGVAGDAVANKIMR